ncbi:unnamed protein product, partial [Didymodactylos carnosus]
SIVAGKNKLNKLQEQLDQLFQGMGRGGISKHLEEIIRSVLEKQKQHARSKSLRSERDTSEFEPGAH